MLSMTLFLILTTVLTPPLASSNPSPSPMNCPSLSSPVLMNSLISFSTLASRSSSGVTCSPGLTVGLVPGFTGFEPGCVPEFSPGFVPGFVPGFTPGFSPGFTSGLDGFTTGFDGSTAGFEGFTAGAVLVPFLATREVAAWF